MTPANRPEEQAAPALQADIVRQKLEIDELHIDRGYINAAIVDDVLASRGEVISKPWNSPNGKLFRKAAFKTNLGFAPRSKRSRELEQLP